MSEDFGPTPAYRPTRRRNDLDGDTPLAADAAKNVQLAQRVAAVTSYRKPTRTRTLVVSNQKGGVGKTTTTVNLAAAMALKGLKVLVIDLDPQGNASTALNVDHREGTPGVYEAIVNGVPFGDLVKECPDIANISVIPASLDLAGAEIELVSLVARESRLDKALKEYRRSLEAAGEHLDYVFIDCPPSLGLLTINALVASTEVLIPIQCEYYALEGVTLLMRTIEMVRSHLNPDLVLSTVLLTMFDARTRLSAEVAAEVRTHFSEQVLDIAIPRAVRVSEAPSYQQTVVTYDSNSPGALSYMEAAREITEKEGR
ncbi:chromosome partitioning ATPase ParA [soil metagenome]